MALDTWLAYTIACIVLTLIPGPSVLLVISLSLTRGRLAALMCILGDVIGSIILMGLSFAGVGAILATSAFVFQSVKWAGVLYLAYLGYKQIRSARLNTAEAAPLTHEGHGGWNSFWVGTVTAILNPKAIVFYIAFLAQFIDPNTNLSVQLGLLTLTSSLVVIILLGGYAFIADKARAALKSSEALKRVEYAGGGLMIGGSVLMATTR
ncbi:Threonine/homoserine/homoserine lactone efflux protein [Cohaesibacter sp. ES.047]|uniref:LysE family translocator n=1 Tax=Cohaesibacter sp. ES.047 TaxID=1798205 RepID=UPI000BB71FA5|nr:LysE family translocator [Cohaesibacter sp. ES.047]SNY93144.1 Threonine/homoserine/homoserine lactone efflux protein [Cohaesibacter sp. ES.047]